MPLLVLEERKMFDTPLGIALFALLVLLGTATLGFILYMIWYTVAGHILRYAVLTRTKKTKWTHGAGAKNPVTEMIYKEGEKWLEENKQYKKDLHIVNDGLNLYGEYFDFGFDRAVIFVSGRTESSNYGYYFTQPYRSWGFNVFVFDQRAHGKSDGKYNTLGFEEHKDLIKWAELLHNEFNVKSIVLHGVCIGSSCCLQALISPACPDYLNGMIADGMYTRFADSFNNHLSKKFKQPTFPTMYAADLSFKLATGHSMRYGNIDFIDRLKKPILFIHSKEDRYSLPYMADALCAKVPHENKKIVLFEQGKHSHLRPTDSEKYDGAVKEFLVEYFDGALAAK